jgi:hypothetical protein
MLRKQCVFLTVVLLLLVAMNRRGVRAQGVLSASTQGSEPDLSPKEGMLLVATVDRRDVRTDDDEVCVGDPVIVTVNVENVSDADRYIHLQDAEINFRFEVRNSKGVRAPMTKRGADKQADKSRENWNSAQMQVIPRGKKAGFRFNLNELFDLTVPDIYTIRIRLRFPKGGEPLAEDTELLVSNVIKIAVADRPPIQATIGGLDSIAAATTRPN